MPVRRTAWLWVVAVLLGLAMAGPAQASPTPADRIAVAPHTAQLAAEVTGEAVICTVRNTPGTNNAGNCWEVDSRSGIYGPHEAGWGWCPQGYWQVGQWFDPQGWWLCAHETLITATWWLGNVLEHISPPQDQLWFIRNGEVRYTGQAGWGHCPTGREIGRYFSYVGWWLCLA